LRVPQVVVGGAATSAVPAAATALPATTTPALLDLNTADVRALELLPGIGPRMAERIVAYRTANGAFGSVEQLQDVPGIGPATFATLREYMTVTP
jgi:competence protein ComEA